MLSKDPRTIGSNDGFIIVVVIPLIESTLISIGGYENL
jgi:hypothetical protein